MVDNGGGDSVHMRKLMGELQFHFCTNMSSQRVGADLLEFAAAKIAEDGSGRNNIKEAAESVGKQTLRRQLCSGGRKKTACMVIPTKSAKQFCWWQRDIFTNLSH